jgi:hypothetical protein
MRLIPTHCQSCARSRLVNADSLANGAIACPDCGGLAYALPGESYAEADVSLFDDLVSMLKASDITPAKAALLADQLQGRSHADPGRTLRRLEQLLPSLGILELLVAHRPASLRKAEGILSLLLQALSSGPRQSGFMAAASPPIQRVKTGGGPS